MSLSVRALTAGLVVFAASPVHAATIADVFASSPRINLALEVEYRAWYLAPDTGLSGHLPADRIGLERYEDSRRRVARAYLDVLGDALADAMIEQIPIAQAVERRYREYSALRLIGEEANAQAPRAPALLRTTASPPVSLRLRLNALGDGFDLAPGFELVRGALQCRLAYRPLRNRVEMSARQPLTERLALELTGGQSLDRGGPEFRLGLTLDF